MDNQQHELYENARRRLNQKKNLYFHFVLFLVGSLFMFIANVFMDIGAPRKWYMWVVSAWLFLFILHFIKVFITDRFMNKNWERSQIENLVTKQQQKIAQFQSELESKN